MLKELNQPMAEQVLMFGLIQLSTAVPEVGTQQKKVIPTDAAPFITK